MKIENVGGKPGVTLGLCVLRCGQSCGTVAHIAGRLNADLDPEDRAKPPLLINGGWGTKPRLPGLTQSLGVLVRCVLGTALSGGRRHGLFPQMWKFLKAK
jgi:hypothetical protein